MFTFSRALLSTCLPFPSRCSSCFSFTPTSRLSVNMPFFIFFHFPLFCFRPVLLFPPRCFSRYSAHLAPLLTCVLICRFLPVSLFPPRSSCSTLCTSLLTCLCVNMSPYTCLALHALCCLPVSLFPSRCSSRPAVHLFRFACSASPAPRFSLNALGTQVAELPAGNESPAEWCW